MPIFRTFFFLGNVGQENIFYDILERKTAFPGCKNKKYKQSENWQFSKGINRWFWSKNSHLYDILEQRKRLWRLKKQEV